MDQAQQVWQAIGNDALGRQIKLLICVITVLTAFIIIRKVVNAIRWVWDRVTFYI